MPTILERYHKVFSKDSELSQKANQLFPDGVTHDSRFMSPFPIYITHADGAYKWGLEDKRFIDYWAGHGALLLGHNHPEIVEAVTTQMHRGTHYGACHPLELEWGNLITKLVPSAERVRFVSSGTEATLMAIRLARTYTQKNRVLKFAGHFHGWHDSLIFGAYPPYDMSEPGIPQEVRKATVLCPPNDIEAVEKYLKTDKDIACVILEPTGASFGTVPTDGIFLQQLRDLTDQHGVLLIFDEVITGFRVTPGGAQAHYSVTPDLTALAKIVAGGLPGGALVGKKEILKLISMEAEEKGMKMHHPGTFNANPLSASAGIAMLKIVKTGKPNAHANRIAQILRESLNKVFDNFGLDWAIYGEFSGIRLFIGHGEKDLRAVDFNPYEWDYKKLKGGNDEQLLTHLRCGLLLNGVDLATNGGMTTAAHTEVDIEATVHAFEQTIEWMKKDGLIS